MYSVYINHFQRNNAIVNTEELMYAVPSSSGFPVTRPIVKSSEDSADNFSFTMESNSPYYDAILPLKTEIRVEYDGDIIFQGRCLAPSTTTVFHTKSVICEGTYAYLNDTFYEGKQEKFRDKITVSTYYDRIFSNHNTMAPTKPVLRGTVGVTLPSETEKYEPTAWTQTSGLVSNLTSNYGGHLRIRYASGNAYLDWYKYYIRDLGDGLRPQVKIGKNILDISSDNSLNNIFTRVIPIGAKNGVGNTIYIDGYKYDGTHTYSGKAMPVSFIRNLYTDQQLTDEFHDWKDYRDAETNYGIIYKTMSFRDADTQAKLWDMTKKWIKECYFGIATSFTVKAVDMHLLDGTVPKILLGECVDVTYKIVRNGTAVWETKKLVCKAVQYDLFNPENNSYTFGFPSDLLEHNRTDRKKSSKQQTSSASSARTALPKATEDPDLTWEGVWATILNGSEAAYPDYEGTPAGTSFYNNGQLTGTIQAYDPADVPDNNPFNHKDKWFSAHLVGKITLPGKVTQWVAVSEERGVFSYIIVVGGEVGRVTHWYSKRKGLKYSGSDSGESSFETFAKLIEKDTDSSWGGSTAAASFRSNGKLNGTVAKCFDPNKCTAQEAAADPSLVFSAELIGKFTLNNQIKYVALSKEYGIFGYNSGACYTSGVRGYTPTTHWYQITRGITYDNISTLFSDASGNVYATSEGNEEDPKTVYMKTTELTGYGSKGEILVGYDLTSQTDNWRIKLNVPIQYSDASGTTRIADGFVSASDFNIDTIPSFKTKLGVFDVVIAGKVNAADIEADMAYLRKLESNTIHADVSVTASIVRASTVRTDDFILNVQGSSSDPSGASHLRDCFKYCFCTESNGTITLNFTRADNSSFTADFNMAATQFYKDALDTARAAVTINATSHTYASGDIANLTLEPDGWAKAQGSFINQSSTISNTTSFKYVHARALRLRAAYVTPSKDGTTVSPGASGDLPYDGLSSVTVFGDSDLIPGNIKDGVTIFGVTGNYEGGGSTISDSDIKIGSYTNTSSEPSGTPANNMKDAILACINNGNWFGFKVTVDGTTAKKYYKMKF